ncbi:MAG TPA: aspartate aminotransferase family protein [Chloroflexota bacterium]|nr:aspartate aminotransferase family protein [Chloroflexota bacterium]
MQRDLDAPSIENHDEIDLYARRGITLVRGEGVYFFDAGGRRYLDLMSNYGVAVLGHAHPAVTDAIQGQATRLLSAHQSFYNDARARFIEALERLLPDGLRKISFANSGGEAVEAALKYARAATGRERILSTARAYHGRTFSALSETGDPTHQTPFAPAGCRQVPYGDLEAARSCIGDAAAIILEPIQGEAGVHAGAPEYLQGLRRICDESGALLIYDEVQTAFRTGTLFGFQHSGARPDIMTLSKPLANGLPIGVTVVSDAVAAAIPRGSHGSTFGGNPLACAAGQAVLTTVAVPGFVEHVAAMGDLLISSLRRIKHARLRAVRGMGLMVAAEIDGDAGAVMAAMQDLGALVIPAGGSSIRFLPPLIIQAPEIEEGVAIFEEALRMAG